MLESPPSEFWMVASEVWYVARRREVAAVRVPGGSSAVENELPRWPHALSQCRRKLAQLLLEHSVCNVVRPAVEEHDVCVIDLAPKGPHRVPVWQDPQLLQKLLWRRVEEAVIAYELQRGQTSAQ
jgi:hypothetical protein